MSRCDVSGYVKTASNNVTLFALILVQFYEEKKIPLEETMGTCVYSATKALLRSGTDDGWGGQACSKRSNSSVGLRSL